MEPRVTNAFQHEQIRSRTKRQQYGRRKAVSIKQSRVVQKDRIEKDTKKDSYLMFLRKGTTPEDINISSPPIHHTLAPTTLISTGFGKI